jgi:photosystem II stability/assembly factor-like uncharacterized protein
MKKIIFIITIITSFSLFAQQGWYHLNSGTTQNIGCIYFLDGNNGVAGCDGGIILRTTNGGTNWQSINLNYNNPVLSVSMFSPSIILAGFQYKLFRSTNSGSSWDTAFGIGSYDFSVISPTTGYLVFPYTSNNIYKTTNSGSSWNLAGTAFTPNVVRCLDFINETTGFAGGTFWTMSYNLYSPIIFKTSSAGSNWDIKYSGSVRMDYIAVYSVSFGNSLSGMAVEYASYTDSTKILKTTNSGDNWTSNYLTGVFNSVKCIGAVNAWLCGNNGVIHYTSNGGTGWVTQNSGSSVNLRDVFFINQTTGWAAGNSGTILKTINGGITSIKNISCNLPKNFSLSQNFPNPFNPATNIKFQIAKLGEVKLLIFDVLGREIATLINEQLQPGTYETEWDASNLASGIYFYKLVVSDASTPLSITYSETRKMVLVK